MWFLPAWSTAKRQQLKVAMPTRVARPGRLSDATPAEQLEPRQMMAADSVDYGVNTLKVAPAAIAAAFGDAPAAAKHYVVHAVPVGTLETHDPATAQWHDPTQLPTTAEPSSLLSSLRSRVITPTTPVRWTAPNIDASTSLPLTASVWDASNDSVAPNTSYLTVKAPGVYINEIGVFNKIVPVATGIPLFLGSGSSSTTEPVMLTQASDLATLVPGAGDDITQAVDAFFAGGGQQAMVMTVDVADQLPADGAYLDNSGLISLIARGLKKVLANLPGSIPADLIVVPAMGGASGSEYLELATAMTAAAANIDGLALLDPPTTLVQQAAADPTTHGPALVTLAEHIRGTVSSPANAALYSSPLVGPSPYGETPASVAAATVIAQSDADVGTWGAPAGMRAVLPARPLLEPSISLAGSLNAAGVNPLMLQDGEPVIWGARTLSTELPQQYIANSRTLETIHKTIQRGLTSYVFQPNTAATWQSVASSVTAYLTSLWNEGGLLGSSASDAFSVEVGLGSTMTADDILNGIMRVTVKLAVMQPNEFVELTLEQEMAG